MPFTIQQIAKQGRKRFSYLMAHDRVFKKRFCRKVSIALKRYHRDKSAPSRTAVPVVTNRHSVGRFTNLQKTLAHIDAQIMGLREKQAVLQQAQKLVEGTA